MKLKGERIIGAQRSVVWAALNDPDILQASIPGCSELTGNASEGFDAVVTQKIGPVRATFRGQLELSDIVEGESYRISGQGKAGPAGYAGGSALVTLSDAEGGTVLKYDVSATVGGKLASLGSRVIDGVAKRLADRFFENFQAAVEGAGAGETRPDVAPVQATGIVARFLNWLKGLFG